MASILIIDDDDRFRETLRQALQADSYEMVEARNGRGESRR
jgi:DNA-binding NtrC family response regulator